MAYIKQEFIDRVLQDADIIDIFNSNEDKPVVKKGSKYFCKSPFTEEKSASCLINPTTQTYYDENVQYVRNGSEYVRWSGSTCTERKSSSCKIYSRKSGIRVCSGDL